MITIHSVMYNFTIECTHIHTYTHNYECTCLRQEVMEELLELQKVKEKEHVEQTRSFKEATAEVKKQKHSQDEMSQKVHKHLL